MARTAKPKLLAEPAPAIGCDFYMDKGGMCQFCGKPFEDHLPTRTDLRRIMREVLEERAQPSPTEAGLRRRVKEMEAGLRKFLTAYESMMENGPGYWDRKLDEPYQLLRALLEGKQS